MICFTPWTDHVDHVDPVTRATMEVAFFGVFVSE